MFRLVTLAVGLVLSLSTVGCNQRNSVPPSNTRVSTEVSPALPSPESSATKVVKTVTPEDLAKAADILSAKTDHYVALLKEGKEILGTKPYPNSYAGLAALDDPSSRAAKFSKFNNEKSVDMSFGDAHKEAYKFFTVENAPDSIQEWQEHMMEATAALSSWAQMGVSWQVDGSKAPKLRELEAKFNSIIAKARADIANLRKGK